MCFEECCGAPGAFLDAVLWFTIAQPFAPKMFRNVRIKVGSFAYWVLILYCYTLLGFALYSAVVGQAVAPAADAAAKILQLKRLLEAGAISQDEFDQKKADLLCQI